MIVASAIQLMPALNFNQRLYFIILFVIINYNTIIKLKNKTCININRKNTIWTIQ